MKLLIASCPKHFHIMQLAIKHAYKNIENITELIISFDDGYKFFSDNIVDDLPISFYEQHGIEYQHDLADALQYKNRY